MRLGQCPSMWSFFWKASLRLFINFEYFLVSSVFICEIFKQKRLLGMPSKKKKSIWRDIVPTSYYPLPPFKSRDKNRRDIFWVLDPPPPLENQGNLLNFLRHSKLYEFWFKTTPHCSHHHESSHRGKQIILMYNLLHRETKSQIAWFRKKQLFRKDK